MSEDPEPVCHCQDGKLDPPPPPLGQRCRGENKHPVCKPYDSQKHNCDCSFGHAARHPREHYTATPAVQWNGDLIDVNVKGGLHKKREYLKESGGKTSHRGTTTGNRRNSIELLTLLILLWIESKLNEYDPARDQDRDYGQVRDRILEAARHYTVSGKPLTETLWVPGSSLGETGKDLVGRLKELPAGQVMFIIGEVWAEPHSLRQREDGDFELVLHKMPATPIQLAKKDAEAFLKSFPLLNRRHGSDHIVIIGKIRWLDDAIRFDTLSGFLTQADYIPIGSSYEGIAFNKAVCLRRHFRKPFKEDRKPEDGPFVPDIEWYKCLGCEWYPGEIYKGRKDDPGYIAHTVRKVAHYAGRCWEWFVDLCKTMPDFPPWHMPV